MKTVKGTFTCFKKEDMGKFDHLRFYVFDEVPMQTGASTPIHYFVWVDKNGVESHDYTDIGMEDIISEGWKNVQPNEVVEVTKKASINDLIWC